MRQTLEAPRTNLLLQRHHLKPNREIRQSQGEHWAGEGEVSALKEGWWEQGACAPSC